MQTTIDQAALLQALSHLKHTTSKKSTLPVLKDVLLQATADTLTLTTTDLEMLLQVTLPATSDEAWSQAVPREALAKSISDLSGALTLQPEGISALRVLQPKNANRIRECMEAGEYPSVPMVTERVRFTVMSDVLAKAVQRVSVTALKGNDARPVFTALLFQINSDGLTLAAADTYRVGYQHIPATLETADEALLLVPSYTLDALLAVLPKQPTLLTLVVAGSDPAWGADRIQATWANYRWYSRLIDGTFPAYQRIIPRNQTTILRVSADELAAKASAMLKVSESSNHLVTLDFGTPNELELMLNEIDNDLSRVVDYQAVLLPEAPFRIQLNLAYVLDAARCFKGQTVEMLLTDHKAPMRVRNTDQADSYECCMMPMHAIPKGQEVPIPAYSALREQVAS